MERPIEYSSCSIKMKFQPIAKYFASALLQRKSETSGRAAEIYTGILKIMISSFIILYTL